jgi:hypothetical protein
VCPAPMPLSYVYSLFRVFGVYLLALKGEYEFSKSKMVLSLSREYPNSRLAVLTLSELRTLNANFFAGASPDLALWVRSTKETPSLSTSQLSPRQSMKKYEFPIAPMATPWRSSAGPWRLTVALTIASGCGSYCSYTTASICSAEDPRFGP